ncbi:MAG: anti-sigma factor antagonist [Oscillospiraceae bacterium]
MELKTRAEGRTLTAQLSGELDHHGAKELLRQLELAIDAETPLQLVLDFSGVSFMDSSGIAVVMRAHRRMQTLGGSAVVVRAPEQARRVLDAANIGRWVRIKQEV